jgi:hypothetical protein
MRIEKHSGWLAGISLLSLSLSLSLSRVSERAGNKRALLQRDLMLFLSSRLVDTCP